MSNFLAAVAGSIAQQMLVVAVEAVAVEAHRRFKCQKP